MASQRIPLCDLAAQHAEIKNEVDAAIAGVIAGGQYVLGPELEAFESAFARYIGVSDCVGVGSGTAALKLALQALGVGRGDEVIMPANTYISCAFAASQIGAVPIFVDVSDDHLMDVGRLESAITDRTRAIMPVHLYGMAADMDSVMRIARRYGVKVLEDVSQAHGAALSGRRLGAFGDAAAFSFYPSKNLGAYGDAGAVCTNDSYLAERVRLLRNLGQRHKNEHEIVGENCRLDALQAAILRVKLRRLDAWNETRRAAASRYDELLAPAGFRSVRHHSPQAHVYYLYVVQACERDRTVADLAARGVQAGVNHPTPIHLQPAYRARAIPSGTYPKAEWAARTALSLPMFPGISEEQIARVATALIECATPAQPQ